MSDPITDEGSTDHELLAALADDFARRYRRGERPGVEEYALRHPALAEQIRELFPGMIAMEQQSSGAVAPPTAPASERVGAVIDQYKLLERLGEGGFGTVYMAEQQHPVRRKVALKLIKTGLDTKQVIARFEAERQALAMMDHENIAKVLDAGATETGRPYFVMELVHGVPITTYCDEHRLPPRDRLGLFVKVCRAVQHAHTKGIIHRDLKPTNVLVTLHDGVAVPKVIDFGVAKATGQQPLTDRTLFTQFAQMVGTPLYMSPEQAEMSGLDVDTRSDVYSLGVLLYELLTGTTPFDKERLRQAAHDEVRRIIREEEPPTPSTRVNTLLGTTLVIVSARCRTEPKRLGQILRGELDWIVMKALEKDRTRRYESANTLALDVQRYLADEQVQACPPSAGYRFRKFARRNKVALLTSVMIAAVLVAATAVSTWQAVRATTAEREARRVSAELALDKGQLLGESGDANLALLWLARSLKLAPPHAVELQEAIRANLGAWGNEVNSLRSVLSHNGGVYAIATTASGEVLTASYNSGTKRMAVARWDPAGNRVGAPLTFPSVPEWKSIAFSPDATRFFVGLVDGGIHLVDLDTGKPVWEKRETRGRASRAVFSPDGRQVLIGYELDSTDGPGLAGKAQLFDVASGTPLGPELAHRRPVYAAAFHPDGKSFVTENGSWGDAKEKVEARFWDLRGREIREPLRHDTMVLAVAYSPDGAMLLTGHWDRKALLWNVSAPQAPLASLPHEGPVASVAFSRDGKTLLTGAFDGTARVWTSSGRLLGPPLRQGHLVDVAVFGADDKSIIVGNRGDAARVWDLAGGGRAGANASHDGASFPLAVSPDGQTVLMRAAEHTIVLLDAATVQPVGKPLPHPGPVLIGGTSILPGQRHACSSDRRRALCIEEDDKIAKLWDPQTGQLVAELKPTVIAGPPLFYCVAFSPDSKIIVTGHWEYAATVWDAATGKFLRELPHGPAGGVFCVAFSPDGKTLLTGCPDNAAHFWDPLTGKRLDPPLPHHTPVFAVAFSPDGKTVVTGDVDRNVQLWDVASRKRLRHLTGHQGGINSVTFSPDGRFVVTGSTDHTARFWDLATGKPIGPPFRHPGHVVRVAFEGDGKTIRTATQDQRTFSWSVPAPMPGTAEHLELWAEGVTGMQLEPDGGVQILDAAAWQHRHNAVDEHK